MPRKDDDREFRYTREYQRFQKSEVSLPSTLYGRFADRLWNIAEIPLSSIPLLSRRKGKYEDDIQVSRMQIEADQIGSMLVLPLSVLLILAAVATVLLPGAFALVFWSVTGFWTYWSLTYPGLRSTVVRIQASDEALRTILYMSMQLQINPNLSEAVTSASGHTSGFLSKDLARIMWKTQTTQGNVARVRDALSTRMKLWRKWSPDFVESLEFLLDSVSRQGEDRKRLLQKSQSKMITSMKENLNQYARNLSQPIRVLNMAGIMLPLMGLIMFPLATIMLGGEKTGVGQLVLYMAVTYILFLPTFLFFLIRRLVSKRPGAYSKPNLEKVDDTPPRDKLLVSLRGREYQLPLKATAFSLGLLIGAPGLLYYIDLINTIVSFQTSISISPTGGTVTTASEWKQFIEDQYRASNIVINGTLGMSLFWGINTGLITYFMGRSYRLVKIRDRINEIEKDLQVGITELENALSKDMPVERATASAIQKFDETGQEDRPLRSFLSDVYYNMSRRNQPFERAVFDEQFGALRNYPSSMLENTVDTLADSSTLGPSVAAQNLRKVNDYISNQKQVEETIKELLDEVVSQMQIQARFIAPIITAVAGSMSILIVQILQLIAQRLKDLQESLGGGFSGGNISDQIALLKNIDSALPPTLLLLMVSLYLVEISVILGYFINGIRNGFDTISRDIVITRTLIYSTVIFSVIVMVAIAVVTPRLAGFVGLEAS